MSDRLGSPKYLCLLVMYDPKNPYDSYYLDQQITACGQDYDNFAQNGAIDLDKVTCAKCLVCCDSMLIDGTLEAKVWAGRKVAMMAGKHTPYTVNAIISKTLEGISK
jgi:hypothetical protein